MHISQLSQGRPETVGEVVKEGQDVYVKLMGFGDRGKVKLSMKVVDQETGKEIEGADTGDDGGGDRPRRSRR